MIAKTRFSIRWKKSLIKGKKRKEKRNIGIRMLRVTKARVNICINSLFVKEIECGMRKWKREEKKNKNLKKAHVHALNKRPIFTFGFAENVDGWISNRTSRVVNEDCSSRVIVMECKHEPKRIIRRVTRQKEGKYGD